MPRNQPIKLGIAEERITLAVGLGLFDFKIEQNVRFPQVDRVVPNARAAFTRLQLDARDIEALIQRLPRLPAHDDPQKPVTLDLGDPLTVRACDEKGERSEVLLSHSKREGPALQVVMDRRYLIHALKLGFTEVLVANARAPLLCKDAKRTFVWMPLGEADPAPAAQGSQAHPVRARRRTTSAHPETATSTTNMPPNEPRSNGEQRNGPTHQDGPLDQIIEAEELRMQLQAALPKTSRLIAVLKQQRRQARVVESALASLRRLQS